MTKKKENPKRTGRPKKTVTPEMMEKLKKLCVLGLNDEQMWHYFSVGKETWYKWMREVPNFADVIKNARAEGVTFVAGKLMEHVRKGNLSAIIFYLKTRGRYSEHSTIELTANSESPVAIPITLSTDPLEASRIYQKFIKGK